jgi:hypothetical protein
MLKFQKINTKYELLIHMADEQESAQNFSLSPLNIFIVSAE